MLTAKEIKFIESILNKGVDEFLSAPDKVFNAAFKVWSKLDDVAMKDIQSLPKNHINYYNELSNFLQI
tara:strand:+ start:233 stop:436 length:204 start_codon:yes stop_codon:yes gene_type:complete